MLFLRKNYNLWSLINKNLRFKSKCRSQSFTCLSVMIRDSGCVMGSEKPARAAIAEKRAERQVSTLFPPFIQRSLLLSTSFAYASMPDIFEQWASVNFSISGKIKVNLTLLFLFLSDPAVFERKGKNRMDSLEIQRIWGIFLIVIRLSFTSQCLAFMASEHYHSFCLGIFVS